VDWGGPGIGKQIHLCSFSYYTFIFMVDICAWHWHWHWHSLLFSLTSHNDELEWWVKKNKFSFILTFTFTIHIPTDWMSTYTFIGPNSMQVREERSFMWVWWWVTTGQWPIQWPSLQHNYWFSYPPILPHKHGRRNFDLAFLWLISIVYQMIFYLYFSLN
jgi:hypothetical protein